MHGGDTCNRRKWTRRIKHKLGTAARKSTRSPGCRVGWRIKEDYFERHEIIADNKQTWSALISFDDRLANRSRNKVQNAIKAGSVRVDNQEVKPNYKVKPGNTISIVLPNRWRLIRDTTTEIPLDIVYEDEDVMVINKPFGIAVHPGVGIPNGTIVNAVVAWHLQQKLAICPLWKAIHPTGQELYTGSIKTQRVLMVIAKNEYAATHLAKQFFDHSIERRYQAIVWGDPDADSGNHYWKYRSQSKWPKTIDGFPGRRRWQVGCDSLEGVGTLYCTLVECQLETGTPDQGAHETIGHTLFGDPRYGGNQILKGTLFSKYKAISRRIAFRFYSWQALHAKVLIVHPKTGEKLTFESELPDDMKTVLEKFWKLCERKENKSRFVSILYLDFVIFMIWVITRLRLGFKILLIAQILLKTTNLKNSNLSNRKVESTL